MFGTRWWTCLLPSSGFCVNINALLPSHSPGWFELVVIRICYFGIKCEGKDVTRNYVGRQIVITKSFLFLTESQSALVHGIAVKQYLWPEELEHWIAANDLATAREFSSPAVTNDKECPVSSMTTHQALHFVCIILFSPHSLKGTCYCLYL